MKAKRLGLLRGGLVVACWIMAAAGVHGGAELGATYDDVIARLGPPPMYIKTTEGEWLYYDRGKVRLEEGRVVDSELISPEALAERQAREREEWERRQALQAELEARRTEEGWALKRARQTDPRFLASPASEQVAFWSRFRARYPEVPVDMEYAMALERYQNERERALREQRERDQERRIRELEDRLREAEERARSRSYYPVRHVVRQPVVPVHVVSKPHPHVCPVRGVTFLPGKPVERRRPVMTSHADQIFGPMPTMHAHGFRGSVQHSQRSTVVRMGF
jgi:hypothetical protein